MSRIPQNSCVGVLTRKASGRDRGWRWAFTEVIELKRGPWGWALLQRGWCPCLARGPPRQTSFSPLRRGGSPGSDVRNHPAKVTTVDAPGFGPHAAERHLQPHAGAPRRAVRAPGLAIKSALGCKRAGAARSSANHRAEHMRFRNGTVVCSFYPNWIFCMFLSRRPHAFLLRKPQKYFLSCVLPHTAAVC